MSKRIGIMGGMFDPVHAGHIEVALAALSTLQLHQVRLVPCGVPNHRDRALCSALQRLDMLRLATRDHPGLVVDDRELNRPGTSYTYETLQSFRNEFRGAQLFFILGADAFASLPGWYRWRDLFAMCHFVVVRRPGSEVVLSPELQEIMACGLVTEAEQLLERKCGLIFQMEGIDNPVSSSQVRSRIAGNQPLAGLLDPRVAKYLEYHRLYRNAADKHQHSNESAN